MYDHRDSGKTQRWLQKFAELLTALHSAGEAGMAGA
jgi:hypothetical protein